MGSFSKSKEVNMVLEFFDFSSVDELDSFVVFEKIWRIRSSGPKILLNMC